MYNFKESTLSQEFTKDKINEVKKLIEASIPFTVCGIPGVGVTVFLRYLATLDLANFIFIDAYKLANLTKSELFKALLIELGGKVNTKDDQQVIHECSELIDQLTQDNKKLVIIFNRFDTLKKEFDRSLFTNLNTLWEVDREKVVFIFTANRPIGSMVPEVMGGGFLYLLSKNYYFKTYSLSDLKDMVEKLYPGLTDDKEVYEIALNLSGGHAQLFHLLLKTVKFDNPLEDQFIRLQLKEIYENFTYLQKKMLQNMVKGKVDNLDPYLEEIGVIQKDKKGIKLFSPLLKQYIEGYLPLKLPIKESKLFKFLKRNEGRIVFKEELFESVWPKDFEGASDWALNSLIYRIRKNVAFKTSGYSIESYKKQGYKLIKS